ncbi:hypothetical protein PHYBOEH_003536 [Phytophthora boehmeriae]|uniref:Glucosylceramidase n=1 Tax=Phytophthora boehmeriae TaxID=109152 RepID=A0A8T1X7Y6_9STRA|nr:hypothetical protein PHYBOEH_003536 [Phytophthora boehmeriae]
MATKPASYGTSSLTSDEELRARAGFQHASKKWSVIGLSVCVLTIGLAIVGFTQSHSHSISSITETAVPEDDEISCFQSSYVDNMTRMMEPIPGLKWDHSGSKNTTSFIAVDVDIKYQEIIGFGGAFTETSALLFQRLPPNKQEELLTLYFDKVKGSAYSFGRVPMGSCDFSASPYSFDDTVDDLNLKQFDVHVTRDTEVLIPFIKRALDYRPDMKMILAPWSPPAWMKRSNPGHNASMQGSVKPVGLRDDMRASWALYFSKFITAYKQHGIPFWGLTPQNEPEGNATWEACAYNAEYEAEFIGEFLGPVLERDHPEVNLMVFDNNRNNVLQWAEVIYNHPTAGQYVDGMAVHWYESGGTSVLDGVEYPEHLNYTHFLDENRFILASESCSCPGVAVGADAWFRAQRYGHDILVNLNNFVVGWVDWNLLLDHKGGPNHAGNYCDAPIIVTEHGDDFFLQPMFYFIQHFSKYIPVGSHRVKTQVAARFAKPGDAQLYARYQSSLEACDGSSRQTIRRTGDDKIQVTGTLFCLDMEQASSGTKEVRLVECQSTQQAWTFEASTERIRMGQNCLSLNHGSTQDGVRITVDECEDEIASQQQWTFNEEDGTMHSRSSTIDQCVTAGYSFVQATAFVTPENRKILVVMNDNTEPVDVQLQFGDMVLNTTILQGAIRTYIWG